MPRATGFYKRGGVTHPITPSKNGGRKIDATNRSVSSLSENSEQRRLQKDIQKTKSSLIRRVDRYGIYENFGQKEIRKLKDKYNYSDMIYGTQTQRNNAQLIDKLDDWASSYSG